MKYEAIFFDYASTLAYGKGPAKLEVPPIIQKTIKTLYNGGYRLAIISNSNRYGDKHWVCEKLQGYGILSYFEAVVSSGAWGIHKPHPLIFLRTSTFMGVHPSRVLMVGDSENCDVEGAKAVGMNGLLVNLDEEIWSEKLFSALEDPYLLFRKPNNIMDFTNIDHQTIECTARSMSSSVKVGDRVVVGGFERIVKSVTGDQGDVVDPRNSTPIRIKFVRNGKDS